MIPAIVTLIVGVAIVIISFFLTDGKKEDTEGSVLTESKENLEKQLDQYCNSLVEQKKNELKKKGDEVKSDMKKGLDEVKSSSKKELEELRSKSKKELDELVQNTKKDMDQLRSDTIQTNQNVYNGTQEKIDAAVKAYEESIEAAKKKMQTEIEACEAQLSEKAKKQMIDYINKSLTDAYEAYDPEDTSEKAPVTYDEPVKETAEEKGSDSSAEEDKNVEAESSTEAEQGTAPDQNNADYTQTEMDEAVKENNGVSESAEDGNVNDENADAVNDAVESSNVDNGKSEAQQEEKADSVVSVEDTAVTDSAFTVVEAENPEKTAAVIAENGVPAAPKNNGRSRKKKRKKSSQNKVVDIWDEGNDVESQVADMHKKGLSIMEIANKLGIGVGEAKVMIDKINETGRQ